MNRSIKLLLTISFVISTCCFYSCNRPFSKYQKIGKTDVEEYGYFGNVKQVDRYFCGKIIKTKKYNKYGFIEEEIEYDDKGEIEKRTLFSYNEWGKIVSKDITDEYVHEIYTYSYDEKGNELDCIEEVLEVYNSEFNISVGKSEIYHNVLEYDKVGTLVCSKKYSRDGILNKLTIYNSRGLEIKVIEYEEDGETIRNIEENSYNDKGEKCSTDRNFRDGMVTYHIKYNSFGKLFYVETQQLNGYHEIREFEYDFNNNLISEKSQFIATIDNEPEYYKGDIVTYITKYKTDSHGSIINSVEQRIYPNGIIETDNRYRYDNDYVYKYDEVGNIVYWKNDCANVETYKFTYY